MSLLVALEVATKNRCADDVIGELDDRELGELILSLLRLFDFAAWQLHSELGRMAVLSKLRTFADCAGDDRPTEFACRMALAYAMMRDGVEPELRNHGQAELQQRVTAMNKADDVPETVDALVAVWRTLLPALDLDLLTCFAHELERS